MINMGSFIRGWRYANKGEWRRRWHVGWNWDRRTWGVWLRLWTPTWHKGRGAYVTMGLGPLKITRGY